MKCSNPSVHRWIKVLHKMVTAICRNCRLGVYPCLGRIQVSLRPPSIIFLPQRTSWLLGTHFTFDIWEKWEALSNKKSRFYSAIFTWEISTSATRFYWGTFRCTWPWTHTIPGATFGYSKAPRGRSGTQWSWEGTRDTGSVWVVEIHQVGSKMLVHSQCWL